MGDIRAPATHHYEKPQRDQMATTPNDTRSLQASFTKEMVQEKLPLTFHQIQDGQRDLTHVIQICTSPYLPSS